MKKVFRIRNALESDIPFVTRMSCTALGRFLTDSYGEKNFDKMVHHFQMIVEHENSLERWNNNSIIEVLQNDVWVPAGSLNSWDYDKYKAYNELTDKLYVKAALNFIKEKPLDGIYGTYQFLRREYYGNKFPKIFNPNELYISFLGIKEEFRGYGLGTELLNYLHNKAQEKGYNAIRLDVAEYNRAIHLYKKLGYKVDCEHGIKGPLYTYHMKKTL